MDEPVAMSPTPKAMSPILNLFKGTMKFPDAIKKVTEGKKIHKLEWKDKEYYGFLNNGVLSLHNPDGKNYQWTISEGDLIGDDYIVI